MEGWPHWRDLEAGVTLENLNRIPADWMPKSRWARDLLVHLSDIKRLNAGFLALLVAGVGDFPENHRLLHRFLEKWHTHVDWSQLRDDGSGRNLFYCALLSRPHICELLVSYGCPFPKEDFDLWAVYHKHVHERSWAAYYEEILILFMDRDLGNVHCTKGPPWFNQICARYRERHDHCRRACVAILGLHPWPQVSRDVLNLIARQLWTTRAFPDWSPK